MNTNQNTDLALIESYIAKGQFERALNPLEKLALANPNDARVWKNLGIVNEKQGNHKDAENHLLRSLGTG